MIAKLNCLCYIYSINIIAVINIYLKLFYNKGEMAHKSDIFYRAKILVEVVAERMSGFRSGRKGIL